MNLPLLKNAKNLDGKKVIVRIDVNVPISDGRVQDDFRIERIIPTLTFLKEKGCRIVLLSHHSDESQTLEPIAEYLNKFLKTSFVKDIFGASSYEEPNTIFLCENLRFFEGEKNNDVVFAKKLAALGDIYVNDAFAVSHRAHASVVSLPRLLPHYAGFLFEEEVAHLEVAFHPPSPFLLILGGRKASTKLRLAEKFVDIADHIFIGGAVVNNIFKARGYEVGTSLIEDNLGGLDALGKEQNVVLPRDVVVQKENGEVLVKKPDGVLPDENILDAGPETLTQLFDLIQKSAFVVWNGPLGLYERGFEKSTIEMIRAFGGSGAQTLVGGGDTIAAISRFGKKESFWFVSTGGGAMLDFLAHRTLPGIDALRAAD